MKHFVALEFVSFIVFVTFAAVTTYFKLENGQEI